MQSDASLITPELIVKLIKEEMKSHKLIYGLNDLLIITEPYYCDLTHSILTLTGFSVEEQNENLYNLYDEWMKSYLSIDAYEFHQELDTMAHKLYQKLISLKLKHQHNE
ncbi:hypothetical protein Q0590_32670 [Rhodocytophaga aerolata]|uniref:Uncharacterized protein n=1 Tax=Rhodocytophaga aerolata TaxID=455078 RepID=A0ABT8RI84_9BACT|nr:hypothetical protein [Rhodocytophaga aerolata]MDO1451074.1 hypothetical protein [Rhodocytophaga aerolata]